MNITLANTLFDSGVLTELYRAGFVTEKIFTYREIYLWVNARMLAGGADKHQAVLEASVKFNTSERTVYYALNRFCEG